MPTAFNRPTSHMEAFTARVSAGVFTILGFVPCSFMRFFCSRWLYLIVLSIRFFSNDAFSFCICEFLYAISAASFFSLSDEIFSFSCSIFLCELFSLILLLIFAAPRAADANRKSPPKPYSNPTREPSQRSVAAPLAIDPLCELLFLSFSAASSSIRAWETASDAVENC